MFRKNKRQKQLQESAKRARLTSRSDDEVPALVEFSDSSDYDDSSDDENFVVVAEKVLRQQTITSLFEKPSTNSFEQNLSKLQKKAQHLHLPFPAEVHDQFESEFNKEVVDNHADKQVAESVAESVAPDPVSSPQTQSADTTIDTVKLRLRLFGEVLPNDLRLKSRWNKSRRARADGHQSLYENNFSLYEPRGHNGGRRPAINIPSARDINRAANRQRVQNIADAVARKRESKRNLFKTCLDALDRAWRQPTLSGRFGCVYQPDDKEKTVCSTHDNNMCVIIIKRVIIIIINTLTLVSLRTH